MSDIQQKNASNVPHGGSIVAGELVPPRADAVTFRGVNPAIGGPTGGEYFAATANDVDRAVHLAREAFISETLAPTTRAALLRTCANRLAERGDAILDACAEETGLAARPRLAGERDRAVLQFRMFAEVIEEGSWVEAVIDHGDALRTPLPKPDVRRMMKPLGPVVVFGASNFPFAYGVTGGDTASAFASGCPVIVKGHAAHPATGALLASVVSDAVREVGVTPGWFSFLQAGGSRDIAVGAELVTHPAISAVGFTGSVAGGTALARLAAARPEPIPVFAEMGSVNPVFVLPGALHRDAEGIADKLAASATNSSGQMCTCPGLIFVVACADADRFIARLTRAFASMSNMTMLTPRTRDSFVGRMNDVVKTAGVTVLAGSTDAVSAGPIVATPMLLRVAYRGFAAAPTLHEECFGPKSIVVVCDDADQYSAAAREMHGSLTGSIFADVDDAADGTLAKRFRVELERRVGRLIFNGVPTGVEVCTAMVHSGPFPACNRPDSTAVGRFAIRRWCRPVCYQNVPDSLLPAELREENPERIFRIVDGARAEPR